MAQRQLWRPIQADDERREQLRRDPEVRVLRPLRQVPFVPSIRIKGNVDVRELLGRDDDDDRRDEPLCR